VILNRENRPMSWEELAYLSVELELDVIDREKMKVLFPS
jgi:hypothetical protein